MKAFSPSEDVLSRMDPMPAERAAGAAASGPMDPNELAQVSGSCLVLKPIVPAITIDA